MMNLINIILSNRKQAQKNMCSVILSHTVQKPLDRSLRCQQPPFGESSNGGGLRVPVPFCFSLSVLVT